MWSLNDQAHAYWSCGLGVKCTYGKGILWAYVYFHENNILDWALIVTWIIVKFACWVPFLTMFFLAGGLVWPSAWVWWFCQFPVHLCILTELGPHVESRCKIEQVAAHQFLICPSTNLHVSKLLPLQLLLLTMATLSLAAQSSIKAWHIYLKLMFRRKSPQISCNVQKYQRGVDDKGSNGLYDDIFTTLLVRATTSMAETTIQVKQLKQATYLGGKVNNDQLSCSMLGKMS